MSSPWRRGALLLGLAAATLLYTYDLDRVPPAMTGDEVEFANHAYALATTGHDLNGRRLPLFIQISDARTPDLASPYWYQPMLFYLMAALLKLLPLSETTVRLPSALIGIVNIALVYAVARRVWERRAYAVLAAALLALTPAHLILSRALDFGFPLPFILAWLWLLLTYADTGRRSPIWVGAVLGLGMFSYVAAWVLMPILLAASLVVLWTRGETWRGLTLVGTGFAVPILLASAWLWRHPEAVARTLQRYDGSRTSDILRRVSLYWNYFDPSFLFFAGGNDPTQTTSGAGVFLLPLSVFIVVGLISLLRTPQLAGRLMTLVFLIAPLPVVIALPSTADYAIGRATALLPFGILLAVEGVARTTSQSTPAVRVAALAVLALCPLQFLVFARDYFFHYPLRSITRFDAGMNRDLDERLLTLVNDQPTPAIYFDGNTGGRAARWLFFVNAQGRPELWDRTRYAAGPDAPPGSLRVLDRPGGAEITRKSSSQSWIEP